MGLKLKNPVILQLALQRAAEEAYQSEIIDNEMEDLISASQEEWINEKVGMWLQTVQEKFKLFKMSETIEINKDAIISAGIFYTLKLGEKSSIKIGEVNVEIARIPGGWVYHQINSQPIFVPYNDEFKFIIQSIEE